MPKVTLITNSDFSGTLFLNYLVKAEIEIEKVYVVAAIRGGLGKKIQKTINLLSKKSASFLWYRSFVEKALFRNMVLNGKPLLTINRIEKQYGIAMEPVKDVDDPGFVAQFNKFKDSNDLVLSAYGSQIFPDQLIDQVKNFWNMHGSYLPYFKGAAPYFWMMLKTDYPSGVTLHQVAEKIDPGRIIKQAEVIPDNSDSLLLYHARCVLAAGKLFVSVFRNQNTDVVEEKHEGKEVPSWSNPSGYLSRRQYELPLSCDIDDFKKRGKRFFRWDDFEQISEMFA